MEGVCLAMTYTIQATSLSPFNAKATSYTKLEASLMITNSISSDSSSYLEHLRVLWLIPSSSQVTFLLKPVDHGISTPTLQLFNFILGPRAPTIFFKIIVQYSCVVYNMEVKYTGGKKTKKKKSFYFLLTPPLPIDSWLYHYWPPKMKNVEPPLPT